MPKAILEFNLPEETEEFNDARNGALYKIALDDIWDQCFRPHFKHGYQDDRINTLLENEACVELLEKIAEIYSSIRREIPE